MTLLDLTGLTARINGKERHSRYDLLLLIPYPHPIAGLQLTLSNDCTMLIVSGERSRSSIPLRLRYLPHLGQEVTETRNAKEHKTMSLAVG